MREEVAARRARRIILMGPTAAVCRDVMVEGESGILSLYPRSERPLYLPSKRRLEWRNGARAILYSSDEPELSRGAQGDFLWGEEVGAWRYALEFFDTVNPGLRLGRHPRGVLTTTPKPTDLMRRLVKDSKDPEAGVVITGGTTWDNAANLAPSALADYRRRYEGTRIGRQELEGQFLEDVPGAVWTHDLVNSARMSPEHLPKRETWERIVIGVDPAVKQKEDGSETGIVCVCVAPGAGDYPHGYVLRDLSGRYSATEWPKMVVRAFHALQADRIVAETNNGGDLVEQAIRVVDPNVPVKQVNASRGKRKRAEPVVALYEQGRIHHLETFKELEEEMTQFIPEQSEPFDRADALVWALTEAMVSRQEVSVV